MMNSSLPSSVALVTGSGRKRLGNAIARDLAERGHAVAIHYHRSADAAEATVAEIKASGGVAIAVQADLSDEVAVDRLFHQLNSSWHRLDVLVNTASTWKPRKLEEIDAAWMLESFRTNCLSTFLCAKAAGLLMARQPTGGAIVNFGDASVEQPYAGHAAYFVAKGSIATLTRCLAVELSARNPAIRVNCLHPGSVMLPPGSSAEDAKRRKEATLVKQADDPQAVVHAVRFLIENPFLTGECLMLDGGRHLRRVDR
jgi:pteridine reductase